MSTGPKTDGEIVTSSSRQIEQRKRRCKSAKRIPPHGCGSRRKSGKPDVDLDRQALSQFHTFFVQPQFHIFSPGFSSVWPLQK
jgi:hypothetical protein